jgi:hypothetical protein
VSETSHKKRNSTAFVDDVQCVVAKSNEIWRFVKSRVNNSLGYPQYLIFLTDLNKNQVLFWNANKTYKIFMNPSRKHIMVKSYSELKADDQIFWVILPKKRSPDGSQLYEIVDAETMQYNLYASNFGKDRDDDGDFIIKFYVLLWSSQDSVWGGHENDKRLWKIEPNNN